MAAAASGTAALAGGSGGQPAAAGVHAAGRPGAAGVHAAGRPGAAAAPASPASQVSLVSPASPAGPASAPGRGRVELLAYAVARTPAAARQIARALLPAFHWSAQFKYLNWLWARESGWNRYAYNPASGAYGIPQAVPGSKMASAGPNWRSNPATQIRWGLRYIRGRYGSPHRAWNHELAYGWY